MSLNIRKEIVEAAQGGFYLAQMLAYHTCLRGGVLKTAQVHAETSESYEAVRAQVMTTLAQPMRDAALGQA